ncbi:TraG family conjugative transposon ATPase [Sphingobacterium yanglingense]|uniref:Conjugation system TraG family ATPase n=1 Tax=Sphingobacterium yanglingense TaxID=1437280 RepID=A0A4R6WEX8_9SPHI|nr:TraG family conjugative transposon ATPase [Sphingobacterium yanglingense]TDQ73810.1 conjugation system TraG family ATPase [Sphingobacterium yanglingense]
MEKWLQELFPIYDINEEGCIVNKSGDVTVGFKLELPEIFTLSDGELETIHQYWIKAIKMLPKNTVIHKQDWFVEDQYQTERQENPTFLQNAADDYFKNRPYLSHTSYLFMTKCVSDRAISSITSNLIRPNFIPPHLLEKKEIDNFIEVCGQFKKIMQDCGYFKFHQLGTEELLSNDKKIGLFERYMFLNTDAQKLIQDIEFKDEIRIGNKQCQFYTLADAEDLPALCGSRITFDKYSTDHTKFPIGFASNLGLLLPCNHVYNQFIKIEDPQLTLKRFETKRVRMQSLSAYSRSNTINRDAINQFLNEAIGQQRLPVKAHFNIMVWADNNEELKKRKSMVATALAKIDATAKEEVWGAAQIFWSCIPGNSGNLPLNDTFDTFAEQASCFLVNETNYQSETVSTGIRFCDRFGRPVYLDLFDKPRKQGISSNMGTLVLGTSGGGKSMTVNHMLRSLYDQGAHAVVIDIGGSYRGLCELLGGYYLTYEEHDPIKFNPFYLPEGIALDTEKKESLKALLVALWKQETDYYNRSEYVALSNALQGYYDLLQKDKSIFPCFDTFYEYLQTTYVELLRSMNVKDKDFDINNFLYVLRPYYKNGEFDYLLNAKDKLDILHSRFVVVELDNIKDHPILFQVSTLLISELFISKMRKLAGTRKILCIDEAWKAITKSSMAEFLKYAFKTIRKFNGIPIVVTQELDDLISSPIIKEAIIANADIKICMDMRKFVNKFDKLQDALGMSAKGKTILLSVNKDNREIYVEVGGQMMKVVKNELSPEEYFAYTTEGKERVKVLEYAKKYNSMELGIQEMVKQSKRVEKK